MNSSVKPEPSRLKQWLYRQLGINHRVGIVLLLGMISGMPLALTGSALSAWLTLEQVSLKEIGFFGLVGLSYSLKFLWAPFLDQVPIPYLSRKLGRRRSWLVVVSIALTLSIIALGSAQPKIDLFYTAIAAIFVAFFSATLDMIIDAYRVEILEHSQQGAGSSAHITGYRIGMLISGAGALALSTILSWYWIYFLMAILSLCGVILAFLIAEPAVETRVHTMHLKSDFLNLLKRRVVEPFLDFTRKTDWHIVLAMVILYKVGDAVAGTMTQPFYLKMGFGPAEIAAASKLFGLIATLLGAALGGVIAVRYGLAKALIVGGLLQAIATLAPIALLGGGNTITNLTVIVFIDNFTSGMGTAALVAYLSSLCSKQFTVTQYALLSALSSVGRTVVASFSGSWAEYFGWQNFFILAAVMAVPGMVLLMILYYRGGSFRQMEIAAKPPIL